MEFSKINPFVRYVHYIPLDCTANHNETVPYDNRIFFTYEGVGRISVSGREYIMNSGAVLVIPSGIRYRLLSPKHSVTYIAVNFDYTSENSDKQKPIPPTEISAYNPLMKLEHIKFETQTEFNDAVYISDFSRMSGVFKTIHSEYRQNMLYSEAILSNLTAEILLRCARIISADTLNSAGEITDKIIAYINENYNKNISNQSIGARFGLHPNYISNLFKALTGMPLHRYVLHTRISFAMEMLSAKKYSIGEIAERCGFSSVYHFTKAFKKIVGVPPSKYN